MAVIGVTENGKMTLGKKTLGERLNATGERTKVEASQLRMPELLLFASLIVVQPIPGIGLPFNQAMLFVIALYGMTQKASFNVGKWGSLFAFLGMLLIYVAVVSVFSDPSEYAADWTRRLIRLVATTILIYVIAVGQIHLRSAILGFSAALLANAILFFAGIAPDTYDGYLTGYLNDKNYAGLVYALFGLLVMTAFTQRWQQITVLLVSMGLLWTTGSRTSLAALLFAYLWIIFSPRLVPVVKVVLLGIFWWLLSFLTEDYADASVFGDRTGTDALRGRIDAMSWDKVRETGFFGRGLGEAYVYDMTGDRTWFFHNSYWSAFVEGGWVWAVSLVAITLFVGVQPLRKNKGWSNYEIIAQGVAIALLVCALRLGEVFYTLPWAICMGYVIRSFVIRLPENGGITLFGYDKEIISTRR